MKSEIEIIKARVNLENYSSSRGFLGYCESKKGLEDVVCWHAIDLLLSAFPILSKKNSIISSLHFDRNILKESYETSVEDFKEYFVPLVNNQLAFEVDFNSISDDINSLNYERKINELMQSFVCMNDIGIEMLKKSIFSVMAIDGLLGHFFLILKDEKLIIYPHDDAGFGFIFFGEKSAEINDFLFKSFSDDILIMKKLQTSG